MQHQARRLIVFLGLWILLQSACAPFRINDAGIAALPKQKQVVVVNFWATWCEPCVEEIPVLVKLQKQHPEAEFVGVSMDDATLKSEEKVHRFTRDHGMNYRVVLRDGQDFEAMVNSMDPDWMGGLPATFVFRDGKRVYSKSGPITEKELGAALSE